MPATGANAPVTTGPPVVDSVAVRIGRREDTARGVGSIRPGGLMIGARAIPGVVGRPRAAGLPGPDATAMVPRVPAVVRIAGTVESSARSAAVAADGTVAAVPGPTVVDRTAVGVRTLPGGTRPRGEGTGSGVTEHPEVSTAHRALNARTAETVLRTRREQEGTPRATIAGGGPAVSATATGLAARRPEERGASAASATATGLGVKVPEAVGVSSRVPRGTPVAGTNGRADLRTPTAAGATPTARRGTPAPVLTIADGEEHATGADR